MAVARVCARCCVVYVMLRAALTLSCRSYDFNPNVCARLGSRSELQPADALLWPGDPAAVSTAPLHVQCARAPRPKAFVSCAVAQKTGHVVMFVRWIDKGAQTYIEAACHE